VLGPVPIEIRQTLEVRERKATSSNWRSESGREPRRAPPDPLEYALDLVEPAGYSAKQLSLGAAVQSNGAGRDETIREINSTAGWLWIS